MMQTKNYEWEIMGSRVPKNIDWLWYPYIPYGKVTVVQGDPGEGKSTMMLQLTGLLTSGRKMPDGSGDGMPRNVIYQAAEDGIDDTIIPRLRAAGADCDRVAYLKFGNEAASLDDDRFERLINEFHASLLVIDPLQSFLFSDKENQGSGNMRFMLTKIANVAERTNCAVVLIGHLNKSNGSKGIYRGLGSINVAAVARSVLLIGRDPDEPQTRIMLQIKNSLAKEGPGYVFDLDPDTGFHWIGESDYLPEQILTPMKAADSKKERAKRYIQKQLLSGDTASTEIYEQLKNIGIGERTAKLARAEMDIMTYRRDNAWYWHLEQEAEVDEN